MCVLIYNNILCSQFSNGWKGSCGGRASKCDSMHTTHSNTTVNSASNTGLNMQPKPHQCGINTQTQQRGAHSHTVSWLNHIKLIKRIQKTRPKWRFFAGNYQENIIAVKKNCSSSRIGFSVCVFFFSGVIFCFLLCWCCCCWCCSWYYFVIQFVCRRIRFLFYLNISLWPLLPRTLSHLCIIWNISRDHDNHLFHIHFACLSVGFGSRSVCRVFAMGQTSTMAISKQF